MNDQERTNTIEKNRWWEFYFIRYFVGTVVGGAILYYLNVSEHSALHHKIVPSITKISDIHAGAIWLLGALGLTYCYIASAPIYSLHVARSEFIGKNWLKLRTCAALFLIPFAIAWIYRCDTDSLHGAIAVFVLSALVLLEIWAFWSVSKRRNELHTYYCELASFRAINSAPIREYVESYRHLREHGNAYLIIIFEFFLGSVLWYLPSTKLRLVAGVVWVLPAALFWFIGNILEYKMVRDGPQCADCNRLRYP